MGFWDTVGKVAKGTLNAVEKQNEEMKKYKAEVNQLSNTALKEKYNSSSGWKKNVLISVIKERQGY